MARRHSTREYFRGMELGLGVGQSAVAYFDEEMRASQLPARVLEAFTAPRPHHVSPEEIQTRSVAPYTVFFHPTHSAYRLDPGTHLDFFWSFYLAESNNIEEIVPFTDWEANGIRVEVHHADEWCQVPQGMVAAGTKVRIFKETSRPDKAAKMIFPPDPSMPEEGFVLL